MEYCPEHTQIREDIGFIKNGVNTLADSIKRLDTRINGSFDAIAKHIEESPFYRGKIGELQTEIKNIKEERNNTTKASQWRIGLVVGIIVSIVNISINLILKK